MTREPRWRQDFPINWAEDDYVTRRQFVAFLTLISGGLFLGTVLVGIREWWRSRWSAHSGPMRVAAAHELPVGGAKLFRYPTAEDPCLLIRLTTDRFVAYNQACTHLACPVTYQPGGRSLHCPCHEGYFSVEDGRPLAGPPKRPLQQIALTVRNDEIWATGVRRG